MMAYPKGKTKRDFEITADEYEELRIAAHVANSGENCNFYGKKPWNYGLTKDTDNRVKQYGEKQSGKVLTKSQKIKISKNHADVSGENNPMFGVHRYGEDNPFYGKHHTDESKNKMSKTLSDGRRAGKNNSMYGKSAIKGKH